MSINGLLDKILYERNARNAANMAKTCAPFITNNGKVVDVGVGNGMIAAKLKQLRNIDIIGIDIVDYNKTDVPFKLYDGIKIPFEDEEFDVALIIQVLHHCDNPRELLKEARRVAKKIVIVEDVYLTKMHLKAMKLYDLLANFRHDVNVPFNFRNNEEWLELFRELGLEVLENRTHQGGAIYSPMRARIYVLAV